MSWRVIFIFNVFTCLLFVPNPKLTAQSFSVMTYNIRYDEPKDAEDNWHKRKKEMADFFKYHQPKVIGTQEGLLHQIQYLDSNMTNYTYVGVGRSDGKTGGEYSALFIDTVIFSIVNQGTFWLSDTPEQVSKGWDAALPRICTYALLHHKKANKNVWVFNTHFDHIGVAARIKSAELVLNKSRELNPTQLPCIIMGDLNIPPNEKPAQIFEESAFKIKPKGIKGTFNGFGKENDMQKIDYIFGYNLVVKKYKHIKAMRKNGRFLSDHFPVVAKIKL